MYSDPPNIDPINVTLGKVVMSPTNDTFCYIVAGTAVYFECRVYTDFRGILYGADYFSGDVLDVSVAFSVDGRKVPARLVNQRFCSLYYIDLM